MIDTDKYEGHTPAPWDSLVCATTGKKWIIDGPEETWGQTIALVEGIGENDVGWINMWLMADAPILLEEVKRLREELRILNGMNKALWDTVENYDICLDDFTMIDLLSPPDGYEYCEDELRWVKKE